MKLTIAKPGFNCGYSLIECVVVISLISVVMVFVGRTLHGLFQAEQASARDLVLDRRLADLAIRFRNDVHAADSFIIADRGSRLECHGMAAQDVSYTISSRGIERTVNDSSARDTFELLGCRAEFRTSDDQAAVELSVARPMPQLGYTPSAAGTPRVIVVRAAPRRFLTTKE